MRIDEKDILVNNIMAGILHKMYKKSAKKESDKELNKNIKNFIEKYDLGHLNPIKEDFKPVFLVSDLAADNSMIFKLAAEQVATGLGLELIINPAEDFKATKKHFVYHSQNCFDSRNPPKSKKMNELQIKYLSDNVIKKLTTASKAAGGFLEVDRFTESPDEIKSAILSLTNNDNLKSLKAKKVSVGYSGALGGLENDDITDSMYERTDVYIDGKHHTTPIDVPERIIIVFPLPPDTRHPPLLPGEIEDITNSIVDIVTEAITSGVGGKSPGEITDLVDDTIKKIIEDLVGKPGITGDNIVEIIEGAVEKIGEKLKDPKNNPTPEEQAAADELVEGLEGVATAAKVANVAKQKQNQSRPRMRR